MFKKTRTLLFTALLALGFIGLSLNAADMKCGTGKCGTSISEQMPTKGYDCKDCPNADCAAKKDSSMPCDYPRDAQGKMKSSAGKCGKAMKNDETMKCGGGKCGTGK